MQYFSLLVNYIYEETIKPTTQEVKNHDEKDYFYSNIRSSRSQLRSLHQRSIPERDSI